MRLVCPNCRNTGFKPSTDVPKALTCYKTDSFPSVIYRYRACLQCGHKWVTAEKHERDVGGAGPDLFSSDE